jgi:hypothetical protein
VDITRLPAVACPLGQATLWRDNCKVRERILSSAAAKPKALPHSRTWDNVSTAIVCFPAAVLSGLLATARNRCQSSGHSVWKTYSVFLLSRSKQNGGRSVLDPGHANLERVEGVSKVQLRRRSYWISQDCQWWRVHRSGQLHEHTTPNCAGVSHPQPHQDSTLCHMRALGTSGRPQPCASLRPFEKASHRWHAVHTRSCKFTAHLC